MLTLPGYSLKDKIFESSRSTVYRALRDADRAPVVLKTLNEEFPSPTEIARVRREFEMTGAIRADGVIGAYALEPYRNAYALVLEDFGGVSLQVSGRLLGVENALDVLLQVAQALEAIHQGRVIHKDINPSNILLNHETGVVKVIDFGISTELDREAPAPLSPAALEGTLAYMAPEQTGRMNRAIDYRTDFYALGATAYQLLTGVPPFTSTDPMELIHGHIARTPVPPHAIEPRVPRVLSEIVLKLMAKRAEDRYQCIRALRADLRRCLDSLRATGTVPDFPIARKDVSERFRIPQKLYGRQAEIDTLMGAFERVSAGAKELVLVAGYSGIGKSAVVHEIHKPIVRRRGYFLSGKFDQLNRNIPYASLIQAFRGHVQQLLSEPSAALAVWRERLAAALGPNGPVIVQVIPEVELILGQQPPVPDLPAVESDNRFNLVFQNFVRTFAAESHPLVLFLDDLQWADPRSLKLLELFLTDAETRHLLVIGAYRDSEVDPGHPLMLTVEELRKAGAVVETVVLQPFRPADCVELVADTLRAPLASVAPLAEVCARKTGGNPFFFNQFLLSLHDERQIVFDADAEAWRWDVDRIRELQITDNVVELMAGKLQRLGGDAQNLLRLASCIGNTFDLQTLATVSGGTPAQVSRALWPALREGLLLPVGDDYRLVGGRMRDDAPEAALPASAGAATGPERRVRYRFLHDRVQQAAYSLIEAEQKREVHLKVGQLMRNGTSEAEREERLFEIVNHLNVGSGLIRERALLDDLAELNLRAGRKANASAAHGTALEYCKRGIDLLGEDGWTRRYDLALRLHVEAAQASQHSTDFEQMERYTETVLARSTSLLHKVEVYEMRISVLIAHARLVEAVGTALEVLSLLGVEFPERPSEADVGAAFEETAKALAATGRTIEELIDLPPAADPQRAAAIRIMANVNSATYIGRPELFPLLVLREVTLSARHGNTAASAFGYCCYGILVIAALGDIDGGYRFGQLAIRLYQRLGAKEYEARVQHIVNVFLRFWKEHARESARAFPVIYQQGLECGDHEYAAWSLMQATNQGFFIGRDLPTLQRETAVHVHAIAKLKQAQALHPTRAAAQAIANLLGAGDDPTRLIGPDYDERQMLERHLRAGESFAVGNLYVYKLVLCYYLGDPAAALACSRLLEPYAGSLAALLHQPVYTFYDSLARLALAAAATPEERAAWLARVATQQEKMALWARHAPMNFEHKHLMVEAERERVAGDRTAARALFKRAIDLACRNEYRHEEALGYELLGRLWLEDGEPEVAALYLSKARHRYALWGAKAKVRELEDRHPELLAGSGTHAVPTAVWGKTTADRTTGRAEQGSLDLASVLKASQTISGEVVLGELLKRMMRIVIENAGAERGFLLLDRAGELRIEAEGTVGREVDVLQSIPLEGEDGRAMLPEAIVRYVARTRTSIVLDDASREGQFVSDRYVADRQPRSILCEPVVNQGVLLGVLYLENNLMAGAFTAGRIEVLRLLSGQIAISIANAELVETLEQRVRERTDQLEVRNRFIRSTFGRYLSSEIVDDLLEKPEGLELGGKKQKVTVMMADLRGFTSMSEGLAPEEVVAVINNYLGAMTEVILRYQGTIDEFIGDAILVVFGAPLLRHDDAERAVACALEMQLAMDGVNAENARRGLPAIHMGIGLNTGEVVVGNIGSPKRAKYGVVGSAVNIAARIESYTVGGQILASESTLADVRSPLRIDSEMKVEPKGAKEPITIHEVGGMGGAYNIELKDNSTVMVELKPEIPVHYSVMEETGTERRVHEGWLVRLSEIEAELRPGSPIATFSNLRLRLDAAGGPEVAPAPPAPPAMYGKVLAGASAADRVRLRFTSVPAESLARLREHLRGAGR